MHSEDIVTVFENFHDIFLCQIILYILLMDMNAIGRQFKAFQTQIIAEID